MTPTDIFGNVRGWLLLAIFAGIGHFAFANDEPNHFVGLLQSAWFAISTLSPAMIIAAFGRLKQKPQ